MNLMFGISKIVLTAATLLLPSFAAVAQQRTLESIERGVGVSDKSLNCETTFKLMGDVRNLVKAEADEKSVLILSARPGGGEKGHTLNRRRLYNVREGLQVTPVMPAQLYAQRTSPGGEVFRPVLPRLRDETRVPLRLPTYLAAEREEYPLHAIVERAAPAGFELLLAFSPDCNGANACRYGIVSGQALSAKARRPAGRAVRLARGVTGYFVDATCEAYCSDSTLTWDQGGYRYTVGIKAAKAGKLVRVANSAIRGGAATR